MTATGSADDWQLGPFAPVPGLTITATAELTFRCPVSERAVAWAAKDLFNPGAVVHDGRVHLLVRGEDLTDGHAGTSRIGLAVSDDGVHFDLEPEPVIAPANDQWQEWEWPGGCEDPRVVAAPDGGGYVCVYTAFDGGSATLMVATSTDLRTWEKHGPAFADTSHEKRWTKSGSIVTEITDGRLTAARLDGRYWMYWGEGTCFSATSTDLIQWIPVEHDSAPDRFLTRSSEDNRQWDITRIPGPRALQPLLFPRRGRFDSLLVEPGPPAVVTPAGVVLVYNGANHPERGDANAPAFAYQPGQALFDNHDPTACIARTTQPFLVDRTRGQVDNVCFAQGLVRFDDRWRLYYGRADSHIGVAITPRSENPD